MLEKAGNGNRAALDELLPLVYDELKRVVARKLSFDRVDHTLQPTALINEAYLRLPEPAPPVLVPIACDITRYRLYDDAVTPVVRQRYEDAIARLKDIAAGRLTLGIDPASTTPAAIGVRVRSRDRVFGDDLLERY